MSIRRIDLGHLKISDFKIFFATREAPITSDLYLHKSSLFSKLVQIIHFQFNVPTMRYCLFLSVK